MSQDHGGDGAHAVGEGFCPCERHLPHIILYYIILYYIILYYNGWPG